MTCEVLTNPCLAYQPCDNHATCETISSSDYNCICSLGYMGQNCTDISDACLVFQPCINGTCSSGNSSDYSCECFTGYTGVDCDINIDDCAVNDCVNGACVDGIASYMCACDPGFTGSLCSDEIDECKTVDCNNGTCIDQGFGTQCACVVGFTGNVCETQLPLCQTNNHYCHNGGTCFEAGDGEIECSCRPHFSGRQCEIAVCAAEDDIPVYPGSSVVYSWPQTEAGHSQNQVCPHVCKGLIHYTPGAVVVRVCEADTSQWLDTDISGCGLSTTALRLCEVGKVSCKLFMCAVSHAYYTLSHKSWRVVLTRLLWW